MNRTPLHGEHLDLGAKMVPFAGWDMPIQYTSIIDEHMSVRAGCGIFDVSHMGNLLIRGDGASRLVASLMTNNTRDAPPRRCVYSHILNEDGAILDDTIVTPVAPDEIHMVPNAATTERILAWMRSHVDGQEVLDLSRDLATIAVQGPASEAAVRKLTNADLSGMGSFWAAYVMLDRVDGEAEATSPLLADRPMENSGVAGIPALVSRTGYTGEDGFEVTCENDSAVAVWRALLEKGRDSEVKPAGLGARDTLRLEKGLLLSGTDFDGSQTSLQTGPSWVVKWDHEFIGRPALERQRGTGGYPVLAGLVLKDKGVPRHGYEIASGGDLVGTVTSGTLSPVMRKGIALGYVPPDLSSPGTALEIRIRGSAVGAEVVKTPFVRRNPR
jgi:aminomethyltransferase